MSQLAEDGDNLHQPTDISEKDFDSMLQIQVEKYVLRLYVANSNPKSLRAIQQINKVCEEYLQGHYELEVIDIYKHPELLEQDQVFATPTLIKQLPPPLQRLIGDLTDTEKLIISLDL